jgi:sensor histidine kinase YesM
MRGRLQAWLLVFAAWTALAVFFALTASLTYISLGQPPIWRLALANALAQWWLWAAATPLVVFAARRWPLDGRRLAGHAAVHLLLSLVVAFVKVRAEGFARFWLFDAQPYLLINNLALQALIYWSLVAAVHALDRYGRTRAQASDALARLSQARLDLLQTQLQPHFLFNALNAASEMIHENPERADLMIGRLSDLLRASLAGATRPKVTLDEEIELVRCYLSIQEARFGERLGVSIDVAPDCSAVRVPRLILQPLVENAIQHGIAPRPAGGRVWISARRRQDHVVVSVENDGEGLRREAAEGIGLANTRARLASLYGDAASFAMAPRAGGGATATLVVPATDRIGQP